MSRAKLFGILVVLAVVGVGAVVVHAEFFGITTVVNANRVVTAPSSDWLQKHYEAARRAARSSADQTIRQDCAAIRKLGATNPNCPPQ